MDLHRPQELRVGQGPQTDESVGPSRCQERSLGRNRNRIDFSGVPFEGANGLSRVAAPQTNDWIPPTGCEPFASVVEPDIVGQFLVRSDRQDERAAAPVPQLNCSVIPGGRKNTAVRAVFHAVDFALAGVPLGLDFVRPRVEEPNDAIQSRHRDLLTVRRLGDGVQGTIGEAHALFLSAPLPPKRMPFEAANVVLSGSRLMTRENVPRLPNIPVPLCLPGELYVRGIQHFAHLPRLLLCGVLGILSGLKRAIELLI